MIDDYKRIDWNLESEGRYSVTDDHQIIDWSEGFAPSVSPPPGRGRKKKKLFAVVVVKSNYSSFSHLKTRRKVYLEPESYSGGVITFILAMFSWLCDGGPSSTGEIEVLIDGRRETTNPIFSAL